MPMTTDAINTLCRHVAETRFEHLGDATVLSAKTFIEDSLGVGVSGSRGPHVDDLRAAALASGGGGTSRVLGTNWRLPTTSAALLNAYQIHNAEYDCVHEQAVVHPMAVLLGAVVAHVDRERANGRRFTGEEVITAVTVGVNVGAGIGIASRSPLRFFRPATADDAYGPDGGERVRKLAEEEEAEAAKASEEAEAAKQAAMAKAGAPKAAVPRADRSL